MIRLAAIVAEFGANCLAKFGEWLSVDQRRALVAIAHCRSPARSMMQVRCTDCAHHFTTCGANIALSADPAN